MKLKDIKAKLTKEELKHLTTVHVSCGFGGRDRKNAIYNARHKLTDEELEAIGSKYTSLIGK